MFHEAAAKSVTDIEKNSQRTKLTHKQSTEARTDGEPKRRSEVDSGNPRIEAPHDNGPVQGHNVSGYGHEGVGLTPATLPPTFSVQKKSTNSTRDDVINQIDYKKVKQRINDKVYHETKGVYFKGRPYITMAEERPNTPRWTKLSLIHI